MNNEQQKLERQKAKIVKKMKKLELKYNRILGATDINSFYNWERVNKTASEDVKKKVEQLYKKYHIVRASVQESEVIVYGYIQNKEFSWTNSWVEEYQETNKNGELVNKTRVRKQKNSEVFPSFKQQDKLSFIIIQEKDVNGNPITVDERGVPTFKIVLIPIKSRTITVEDIMIIDSKEISSVWGDNYLTSISGIKVNSESELSLKGSEEWSRYFVLASNTETGKLNLPNKNVTNTDSIVSGKYSVLKETQASINLAKVFSKFILSAQAAEKNAIKEIDLEKEITREFKIERY